MPKPRVHLEGFDRFRRDLGKLAPGIGKQVAAANFLVGNRVASEGRRRYKVRYEQHFGHGAASFRAGRQQKRSLVKIGSARAPYVVAQNFGSDKIRRFSPKAYPDRFVYDVIDDQQPEIVAAYDRLLAVVVNKAFPEPKTPGVRI